MRDSDKLKPGILNGGKPRRSLAEIAADANKLVQQSGKHSMSEKANLNPSTQAYTEWDAPRTSKIDGMQLPGDRTRKVPGEAKAGQNVAGEADHVKVTTGDSNPGKQTWKGARAGYTTREIPNYKPSPASSTHHDTDRATGMKPTDNGDYTGKNVHLNGDIKRGGGSPRQSVKGKHPGRTGGAFKSVAGTSSSR